MDEVLTSVALDRLRREAESRGEPVVVRRRRRHWAQRLAQVGRHPTSYAVPKATK